MRVANATDIWLLGGPTMRSSRLSSGVASRCLLASGSTLSLGPIGRVMSRRWNIPGSWLCRS